MNSRRFIRSSLQLEETGGRIQVSMVVALTADSARLRLQLSTPTKQCIGLEAS